MIRTQTCCSWRLIFLSTSCDHIVELFAQVGTYSWTGVCDLVFSYTYTRVWYIDNSIVYNTTSLCLFCWFLTKILQIFQSDLCHDLKSDNYYFDLIIYNYYFFIFTLVYNNIISFIKITTFYHPTSSHKKKVRVKHQNTSWYIRLIWNIKGGKPTLVNNLFLITLFICSDELNQTRKW